MMERLTLYGLLRNDLESMPVGGKACAQLMHAANHLTYHEVIKPLLADKAPNVEVLNWSKEADAFGTTISLDVGGLATLERIVEVAKELGFAAGLVVDPSYPYLVSEEIFGLLPEVLHATPPVAKRGGYFVTRRETTCGYIFGPKDKLDVLLGHFALVGVAK